MLTAVSEHSSEQMFEQFACRGLAAQTDGQALLSSERNGIRSERESHDIIA